MKKILSFILIVIALFCWIALTEKSKYHEEHNGFKYRMRVETNETFSKIYGYNFSGRIDKFVYKEPGREESIVAVVKGHDVPLYLLKKNE